MQAKYTDGIILTRINFGESDRIITVLTKDFGKIKLIARGARKEKSKLAGGIELFTVSNFGYVPSRGELDVLISSRLKKNYGAFVADLNKVNFAYETLKKINKLTEARIDEPYFELMTNLLAYLSDSSLNLVYVEIWWLMNLAKLTGHSINLEKPINDASFNNESYYSFVDGKGGFNKSEVGFSSKHIKLLMLSSTSSPQTLQRVKGGEKLATELVPMLRGFVEYVH